MRPNFYKGHLRQCEVDQRIQLVRHSFFTSKCYAVFYISYHYHGEILTTNAQIIPTLPPPQKKNALARRGRILTYYLTTECQQSRRQQLYPPRTTDEGEYRMRMAYVSLYTDLNTTELMLFPGTFRCSSKFCCIRVKVRVRDVVLGVLPLTVFATCS